MSLLIPPEIAAINDVIKAARDSVRALTRAAEVEGIQDTADLRAKAADREALADTLCDIVRDHGETPPAENTQEEGELIEGALTDLRAGLSGDPEAAARDLCEKAEIQLSQGAKAAIAEDALPDSAATLITPFAF